MHRRGQPPVQPLPGPAHPGKVLPRPQSGQNRHAEGRRVGHLPRPDRRLIAGQRRGGQPAGGFRPVVPQKARPNVAGAGKAARRGIGPMGRPQPGQRQGHKVAVLGQNGLAVFNPQVVVGAGQNLPRGRVKALRRGRPRRGKGAAVRQLFPHQRAELRRKQHPGRIHQGLAVRRFGPEGQHLRAGQGAEQGHARRGKALGALAGPRGGNPHHQAGPALQGGRRPHRGGQQGQGAPLHHRAAHGHGHLVKAPAAQLGQLPGVPGVKRVVFSDQRSNRHGVRLLCALETWLELRFAAEQKRPC